MKQRALNLKSKTVRALPPTRGLAGRFAQFMGHQSVRAVDNSWPSLLLRISVNRSKVSRVALPTHVRNTTSSPRQAGAL